MKKPCYECWLKMMHNPHIKLEDLPCYKEIIESEKKIKEAFNDGYAKGKYHGALSMRTGKRIS